LLQFISSPSRITRELHLDLDRLYAILLEEYLRPNKTDPCDCSDTVIEGGGLDARTGARAGDIPIIYGKTGRDG